MNINFGNFTLRIKPKLLGWTPRIAEDIKESWLELGLVFVMDEITYDFNTGKLKDGIKEIIIDYMMSFSNYFNETGVYFTDEVTDGMPWEALIDAGGELWAFDIAIIPEHIQNFYCDIPGGFLTHRIQGKDLFIRDVL